jgi:hypothetical protein
MTGGPLFGFLVILLLFWISGDAHHLFHVPGSDHVIGLGACAVFTRYLNYFTWRAG